MKRIKQTSGLFLLLPAVFFISLAGCGDFTEIRPQIVEEEYEQKIREFKAEKVKECREEAISIASRKVDSILIARAKLNKDTLDKPVIPEKPVKPEIKQPLDSSEVGPILKKDGL